METNKKTKDILNGEYKEVRQRCIDTCNIIGNITTKHLDASILNEDNIKNKSVVYMEGLRTEIEHSNTSIVSDKNCLTSMYLAEMKKKNDHLDELIAFRKGSISDTSNEIERLKKIILPAKEALSKPRVINNTVRPEHLLKAKDTFQQMKNELKGLIQSLFPDLSEDIQALLGQLMQERLNEESNGYIHITDENFAVIEILSDLSIVTEHPYNKNQVKLAL